MGNTTRMLVVVVIALGFVGCDQAAESGPDAQMVTTHPDARQAQLGDRCRQDTDCPPDLACQDIGSDRLICTYHCAVAEVPDIATCGDGSGACVMWQPQQQPIITACLPLCGTEGECGERSTAIVYINTCICVPNEGEAP